MNPFMSFDPAGRPLPPGHDPTALAPCGRASEALKPRVALSQGEEFRVNTTTRGDQSESDTTPVRPTACRWPVETDTYNHNIKAKLNKEQSDVPYVQACIPTRL